MTTLTYLAHPKMGSVVFGHYHLTAAVWLQVVRIILKLILEGDYLEVDISSAD